MSAVYDPYRVKAEIIPVQDIPKEKIIFVYGNSLDICPICETINYSVHYGHRHEFCSPFRRMILKKYWFKPNLICSLESAHYHCFCCKSECQAHWVVIKNEDLKIHEI